MVGGDVIGRALSEQRHKSPDPLRPGAERSGNIHCAWRTTSTEQLA
jgi:hypothetical protein